MITTQRLAGYGIQLLAVAGIFLCLGGIIGTWFVKNRVDAVAKILFETTDQAFGFVDNKLDLVKQGLDRSRSRVGEISRIAEDFKSAEPVIQQKCEPLLQIVESIHVELTSAQSWLDSGQAIAGGISRISATVMSSDYAARKPEATSLAVVNEIHEFANSVNDTLTTLENLRIELSEVRTNALLARDVTLAIIDRVSDLDTKVNILKVRMEKLDAKVAAERASYVEQAGKFHRWTLEAAIIASILPLWFGFSQIVVMAWGRRMACHVEGW